MSAILFVCTLIGSIAGNGIDFSIRDINTGYGIQATVDVYLNNEHYITISTDENGNLAFNSKPGEYTFIFSAPNYETIETKFLIEEEKRLNARINLTPIEERLSPDKWEDLSFEDVVLFYGYVVDKISGKPIPSVSIRCEHKLEEILSDNNGYFEILIPASDFTPELPPQKTRIVFEKKGYRTVIQSQYLIAGRSLLKIALEQGEGAPLYFEDEQGIYSPKSKTLNKNENGDCPQCKRHNFTDIFSTRATYLDPPQIIRVGTNCVGYNCSSVEVMSLEAYVRSGIDDEWIASWHYNSLRAGAVPYRSYGAWYVYHPISQNYDITNNTYCQVWNPDQYQSCINAAIYTSGIMISYSGAVARSEYSAENNDCGCGNGYSGTGSTWPCISDNVCSGQSCYGHGRGMCQWGSQRWANNQGYSWYWIINHYYNPGSYYPSTPMYITNAYPNPNNVAPLDTFTIYLSTYNGAEDNHPNIMIGASLYNGNYYSDPVHDKKVTINVGNDNETRIFVVPGGTPFGTYDLLVALWFDVDGNNQINSGDFSLYLVTLYDAINISQQGIVELSPSRLPEKYILTITPNPLNQGIVYVKYGIPKKGLVKIRLFDSSGRLIKTIAEGICEPGFYQIQFNAAELPPSIYFVELAGEGYSTIKKMVKIK